MNRESIAIYGASGFGREVAWLLEACEGLEVVCFIDDDEAKIGKSLNGLPIVGLSDVGDMFPGAKIVSGIGVPRIREHIVDKAETAGFQFATIVHPKLEMSRWIEIGEGTVICAGCILTTNIRLGKQVQINLDCTVGHDVVMGDYTTLAPGVHVSGWVHFGKRVYVGTGAVFINGTEESPLMIGDDVVIGAGACITKSIDCGTWGGCRPGSCEGQDRKTDDGGQNSEDRGLRSDETLPSPESAKSAKSVDRFEGWQYPLIEEGKPTKYNWVVQNKDGLRLGYWTDIGAFTYINAKYGVTIEDEVQIGSHCSIYSVSTIDGKSGPVVLKKGCRIGTHSTVMPGVTVGENAVVGAHSFVNWDVGDREVVAGVPAKRLAQSRKVAKV